VTLADRFVIEGLDWIVPAWPVSPHVQAFATTRNGGVSATPYATLNLGFTTSRSASADSAASVRENRRRVARFLPSAPVWLDQAHGTDVAIVAHADVAALRERAPIADAAVTRDRDVVLAVLTADCLPILLADRRGGVVGIAHAGWRGLARGVVENAIAAMRVEPRDVVAWLGPGIGPHAFEVRDDVHTLFVAPDRDAAPAFVAIGEGKWLADLYALARRRLARAGVRDVHGGGFCTHADAARFFSYRRDGETGRMATLLCMSVC
jgi:YfiH family protein